MNERTLHGFDDDTERLAHRILDYVIERVRMSPPPLDAPREPADLAAATGEHRMNRWSRGANTSIRSKPRRSTTDCCNGPKVPLLNGRTYRLRSPTVTATAIVASLPSWIG